MRAADVVVAAQSVKLDAEAQARVARTRGEQPVTLDEVHEMIAAAFGEFANRIEEAAQ